jgi:DNA-binding XRE family transcriptional regulator
MATRRASLSTARKAAGYTQEQLAEALHLERSTIVRWEAGQHVPQPYLWPKLGRLLSLSRDQLREMFTPSERPAATSVPSTPDNHAARHHATLDSLRQVVLGRRRTEALPTSFDATAAKAATREAHRLYQSADYDGAAGLLPTLLWQLECLTDSKDAQADSRSLAQITAAAYIAAAKLATKQADAGLAWVTADRALRQAQKSEHQGLVGAAQYQVACALLHAGHDAHAEQVTTSTAEDMAASPKTTQHQETVSVHGALLLLSAILAARRRDRAEAEQYLQRAWQLAEQLAVDGNWLWTAFGPTNVAIHEVAVRLDLGDTDQAVQLGAVIDTDRLPSVLAGRRSQVHLDLARGAVQQGDDSLAVLHLLEGERVASQVISRNAMARSLLETLLARERTGVTPGLRALASRADVLA